MIIPYSECTNADVNSLKNSNPCFISDNKMYLVGIQTKDRYTNISADKIDSHDDASLSIYFFFLLLLLCSEQFSKLICVTDVRSM